MAKVKAGALGTADYIEAIPKKTSQGGNHSMIKTSSMSKSRRRSYKKYRGQGKRQEKQMACTNEDCENPLCDCDPCYCKEDDECPCCIGAPE